MLQYIYKNCNQPTNSMIEYKLYYFRSRLYRQGFGISLSAKTIELRFFNSNA